MVDVHTSCVTADEGGSSEATSKIPVSFIPESKSAEEMEVQEQGDKERQEEEKEYDPLKWLARDEGTTEKKKPTKQNTGRLVSS